VTVGLFESLERRLGVRGKLLIAPVFILLLFAVVTFYSVREFQALDERMGTVARELAPETAIATGIVVNLYQLRLSVFDYYATGNKDTLSEYRELEAGIFSELDKARTRIDAPERRELIGQIEQATRAFTDVFRNELVTAKQQVQQIVADELDKYGPEASQALRRAIDGVTNREPDSPLRVSLEQLIHDTLLMRSVTQRYFADGTTESEKTLNYAMEDVSDAITFLDMDTVPDFVRQYMDAAITALQNYQASVEKLLAQQTAMNLTKNEKLDELGPEIMILARNLEQQVFGALDAEADEVDGCDERAAA